MQIYPEQYMNFFNKKREGKRKKKIIKEKIGIEETKKKEKKLRWGVQILFL